MRWCGYRAPISGAIITSCLYIHADPCLIVPGAIDTDMARTVMAQVDDATVAMAKTLMVRCCGPPQMQSWQSMSQKQALIYISR